MSACARRYRDFLNLLERWPVDFSKADSGRDFGQHLRNTLSKAFAQGEMSAPTEDTSEKTYESLDRMATDFHRKQHVQKKYHAASGCNLEELKIINSTECLKAMQEKPSLLERLGWKG